MFHIHLFLLIPFISPHFIVVDELVVCTVFQVPPTLRFSVFDLYQVPPELIFSDGLVVVVYPLVEDVSVPVDDEVNLPVVVPVTDELTGEEEDLQPVVLMYIFYMLHLPLVYLMLLEQRILTVVL